MNGNHHKKKWSRRIAQRLAINGPETNPTRPRRKDFPSGRGMIATHPRKGLQIGAVIEIAGKKGGPWDDPAGGGHRPRAAACGRESLRVFFFTAGGWVSGLRACEGEGGEPGGGRKSPRRTMANGA